MTDEYTYPEWLPNVDELGSFMSSRTMGGAMGAIELGTFDETTRPTAVQALERIHEAADRVIPKIGDVTGIVARLAKQATLVKAAHLIEINYTPEQAARDGSTASLYAAEFKSLMADLTDAAMEVDATGENPDAGDGIGAVGWFEDERDPCAPVSWMNRAW